MRLRIRWDALPKVLRPSSMGQAPRCVEGHSIGYQGRREERELIAYWIGAEFDAFQWNRRSYG